MKLWNLKSEWRVFNTYVQKFFLTVLKKTLGENQDISKFSTSKFQDTLDNLGNEINKEIFLDSLESELFKKIEINKKLLKEKIVKIYKIKNEDLNIDSESISKYENEIDTYRIEVRKVDLVKYINETIINESIIKSFYDENINIFTKPKTFSYDQIIVKQNDLSSLKFEDYRNDKNKINSFTKIEKQKILPQIYSKLNELNENKESGIFKIGDLNYIVKLNKINPAIIYTKQEVKLEIINKIIDDELKNIEILNLDEINNEFIEEENLYSDNFSFRENLDKDNYKIFEGQNEGNFIDKKNIMNIILSKRQLIKFH